MIHEWVPRQRGRFIRLLFLSYYISIDPHFPFRPLSVSRLHSESLSYLANKHVCLSTVKEGLVMIDLVQGPENLGTSHGDILAKFSNLLEYFVHSYYC